ncbi:MAG TPA: hypothetical protein VFS37_11625 [Conexibacter sp.]|nr:hypothetical protein [Conexibacter sp.]
MAFDISRLRRGEKIAAVAAVVLFILMFFDWYTVSVSGGLLGGLSVGGSAWQSFGFIDIVLLVTILAAIALAVLTATERSPALPVTLSVIVTALAGLATLLVLYRLIDTPVGDVPDGVDVSRTVWAFLGLVAVAAITYGGYLSMREEGSSFSDARDQARAAFDSAAPRRDDAGSASAPPPPPPAASEPPAAAPPSDPPAGASFGSEPPPSSTA